MFKPLPVESMSADQSKATLREKLAEEVAHGLEISDPSTFVWLIDEYHDSIHQTTHTVYGYMPATDKFYKSSWTVQFVIAGTPINEIESHELFKDGLSITDQFVKIVKFLYPGITFEQFSTMSGNPLATSHPTTKPMLDDTIRQRQVQALFNESAAFTTAELDALYNKEIRDRIPELKKSLKFKDN